jgi:asparagine synthase (glutamine-hydrolysing)
MHKLADVVARRDFPDMYRALISAWKDPAGMVIRGHEPPTLLTGLDTAVPSDDILEQMMYWDLRTYLPGDILTKVDRASMAVSLEARVPLLDHRVVELAWRLPLDYKLRDGKAKWVLRQVLDRHVPARLIDRPKRGFSVPLEAWLKGPLRDWAEALLDRERLVREGVFHPDPIRKSWREFQSGSRRWQSQLWIVLMFQAWLANQGARVEGEGR